MMRLSPRLICFIGASSVMLRSALATQKDSTGTELTNEQNGLKPVTVSEKTKERRLKKWKWVRITDDLRETKRTALVEMDKELKVEMHHHLKTFRFNNRMKVITEKFYRGVYDLNIEDLDANGELTSDEKKLKKSELMMYLRSKIPKFKAVRKKRKELKPAIKEESELSKKLNRRKNMIAKAEAKIAEEAQAANRVCVNHSEGSKIVELHDGENEMRDYRIFTNGREEIERTSDRGRVAEEGFDHYTLYCDAIYALEQDTLTKECVLYAYGRFDVATEL